MEIYAIGANKSKLSVKWLIALKRFLSIVSVNCKLYLIEVFARNTVLLWFS